MNTRASSPHFLSPLPGAAGIVLVAALLVAGCQGPQATRIQENPALFQSLDPFSRQLVREGLVNLGFSSNLVYMALGKPNRVTRAGSAGSRIETWTYRNFLYANPSPKVGFDGTRPVWSPMSSIHGPDGVGSAHSAVNSLPPGLASIIDMPIGTLHVDLLEGLVVRMRIDP